MSRVNKSQSAAAGVTQASGADKSAFVERLHTILSHWPSADRLARAMGVSPSAFRKWLKGEAEPSRERLVALARAAGVGVAWLAEGEGPTPEFDKNSAGRRKSSGAEASLEMDWGQFVLLPKRPKAAAAGAETPPRPSSSEFIALHQDWVRSVCGVEPDQLVLEIASGESMIPTIRDRDTLLIDTSDRTFQNFGIYVLEIDGHRLVKRVQRKHDGSLILICDNNAYQPDTIDKTEADQVTVIGRVVWSGGKV
jgi:phage repressor protein C with HTH and peptisase S24 domain